MSSLLLTQNNLGSQRHNPHWREKNITRKIILKRKLNLCTNQYHQRPHIRFGRRIWRRLSQKQQSKKFNTQRIELV